MSQYTLDSFGAYQKAKDLFDLVGRSEEGSMLFSSGRTADWQCGFDLCEH
jgi:hypothetical protein